MYFIVEKGIIICGNCDKLDSHPNKFKLNRGMVFALRHIIFSDMENLISFNLSDKALENLSVLSEKYIVYHVYSDFKSLRFFKEVFS